MKVTSILLAAAGSVAMAASAHAATSFTVDAGYMGDTTVMAVNNTGSVSFTDVVINAVGGAFSGSEDLGALASGSVGVPFSNSGGAFSFDYDDYSGFTETSYQVTAYFAGGSLVSQVFSPSSNETGAFVDFLGTGSDGYTGSIQVASATVAAVPETATWAMMLVGMGVVGFALRQRARTTVAYA